MTPRPIDLIVPDAGPLMTLAYADRLDLLQVFGRPVKILDVTRLECLRKPTAPDAETLARWFATSGNQIEVLETPFGEFYATAIASESRTAAARATRGLGDAALTWFLSNLDTYTSGDTLPLILTENRDFAMSLRGRPAHVLSTRAWLAGLQAIGAIASASQIIAEIELRGRLVSDLVVDASAAEVDSDWIAAVRADN